MSYVDIAIIAILVIFAIVGLAKGFFKSILALFGTLVALAIAFFLGSVILKAALEIPFFQNIFVAEQGSLASWISGFLGSLSEVVVGSSEAEIAAAVGDNALLKIAAPLIAQAVNALGSDFTGVTLDRAIGVMTANAALYAIIVTVLFIILKLILSALNGLAEKLRKNNVIRGIDRLFGFLVGIVQGAVVNVLLIAVMLLMISMPFMAEVRKDIEYKSVIAKPVTEVVLDLMKKFDLHGLTNGILPEVTEIPHEMSDEEAELAAALTALTSRTFGTTTLTEENFGAELSTQADVTAAIITDATARLNHGPARTDGYNEAADIPALTAAVKALTEPEAVKTAIGAYLADNNVGTTAISEALTELNDKLTELLADFFE